MPPRHSDYSSRVDQTCCGQLSLARGWKPRMCSGEKGSVWILFRTWVIDRRSALVCSSLWYAWKLLSHLCLSARQCIIHYKRTATAALSTPGAGEKRGGWLRVMCSFSVSCQLHSPLVLGVFDIINNCWGRRMHMCQRPWHTTKTL